jgi:hypothetical protein
MSALVVVGGSSQPAERALVSHLLPEGRDRRILRTVFGRKVVLNERFFSLEVGQSVCTRLANEGIDAELVEPMLDPRSIPLGAAIEGPRGHEPHFHLAVPRRDVQRVHQILGW